MLFTVQNNIFINLLLNPFNAVYDLILKKIFLLAKYAKIDKVNVIWVLKFNWQLWGDFAFLY